MRLWVYSLFIRVMPYKFKGIISYTQAFFSFRMLINERCLVP